MVAVFRDGHDPLTGRPLGRSYTDLRTRPVVGYDLTFTVPKSAAVVWALGDERTRAGVLAAHHAAVSQALTFVEDQVVRTRVGAAGLRQVRTQGMVAAAFDHWDTRAGDPGLHTHVVLANKVQGPDGVWRALDGKTVHAATVTVSELYDGLLADELHRRLGVTWSHRARGADRNDAFEIDGIDDTLIRAFSSRADQIHEAELDWTEDFRDKRGRGPSRVETIHAREYLTRATRPAKVLRPLAELFTAWANRARELTGAEPHDLAARALTGDYQRGLRAADVGPLVREAFVAQMLDDAAERRSVWSEWNLGAAAARVTKTLRMASPRQRHQLLGELTQDAAARCVHLDDSREPATRRIGESMYTSVELLAAERVVIDAADREVAFRHLRSGLVRVARHRPSGAARAGRRPARGGAGDCWVIASPGRAGGPRRDGQDDHAGHPRAGVADWRRAGRGTGAVRVCRAHAAAGAQGSLPHHREVAVRDGRRGRRPTHQAVRRRPARGARPDRARRPGRRRARAGTAGLVGRARGSGALAAPAPATSW